MDGLWGVELVEEDDVEFAAAFGEIGAFGEEDVGVDGVGSRGGAVEPGPGDFTINVAGGVAVEAAVEPDVAALSGAGEFDGAGGADFGVGEKVIDDEGGEGRDVVDVEGGDVGAGERVIGALIGVGGAIEVIAGVIGEAADDGVAGKGSGGKS